MISVITPTVRGGLGYLAGLLPNLVKEDNIELIVVDNNSRDGTANYMQQFPCKLLINPVGKSFSQSNNQAAKVAEGDYLLFLNNDTRINPGFSMEMFKTFQLDDKIAVVGCLIYLMDNPKRVQHAGVCFNQDYVAYELGLPIDGVTPGITLQDERVRSVREVNAVTAACMMVKKDVFNEVGGFDEQYINGWEDVDLNLKIKEKGYKIWYTGKTFIRHHHFGSKDAGRFRYEKQNRQRYDKIWVETGRAKEILGNKREL